MVAYNFRSEFAPLVSSGQKRCTIRANRKSRHARPGEALQLYTEQRTKACRKLVAPDPVCVAVLRVAILREYVVVDGALLAEDQVQDLAIADGFKSADEFLEFFRETHGLPFKGVLIQW